MKAKLFKYLGLPCALVMLGNTSAMAEGKIGTISQYTLNMTIDAQRGVCIKMNPTLPTVDGSICLWKDNTLYQEGTNLLLEAYSARKTC
ncbi:MAG: hypothetical protein ACYTX0_46190, partial [Nostoc sp.]